MMLRLKSIQTNNHTTYQYLYKINILKLSSEFNAFFFTKEKLQLPFFI